MIQSKIPSVTTATLHKKLSEVFKLHLERDKYSMYNSLWHGMSNISNNSHKTRIRVLDFIFERNLSKFKDGREKIIFEINFICQERGELIEKNIIKIIHAYDGKTTD